MLAHADIADAVRSPEFMPPKGTQLSGRMFLPADFPELELFGLLLARFGHPNGPMTFLLDRPQGDPDAPFKWDFIFVPCGELKLQILRASSGIDVWWWGEAATEAEIVAYLQANIARHEGRIKAAIQDLEKHVLILNPYVRHRSIAEFALQELNQHPPVQPVPPKGHVTRAELEDYVKKQREFGLAVERQAALMLLLVSESAFMAESFLNLLLAFLMRREIKSSKTIMTETLMRKWRSKIERLHVDCLAIPEAANMGDARLGDAKRMFDIRNRIAHSYPDKEDMAVGQMWFYQCFPILEKGLAFANYAITFHNQLPSLDEAKFCKRAADGLIEFLLELVDSEGRDTLRFMTNSNPLGFNETKGVYSVPFGNTMIVASVTTACPPRNAGAVATQKHSN